MDTRFGTRRHPALVALLAALAILAAPTAPRALTAGDVLGPATWQQAEDLLPPEILRHYRSGEYVNRIIEWPRGIYRWDPEFRSATEANADRYAIDETGGIIERASRTQPPFIYGFPFPQVEASDPQAAVKILWNYQYQYWNEGNSRNVVLLLWLNPDAVVREAQETVYYMFYDGQGPLYRVPNPNNYQSQFVAVATSPADLNGTATLTWRYRDPRKRDSNWVYVPALRRVRAVSPANRSDGFLGSDLSLDDGPFFDGKPEDFTWTLKGEADVLRLVDPLSFEGHGDQTWLPEGGWRAVWPDIPTVGFQDPAWKGVGWAPVPAALARRTCWIIEGTPKDRYYLFGKVQLYIDKETYHGAWNRKFSWTGELVNTFQVVTYQKFEVTRPDGNTEWLWRSNFVYQCAENVKLNRATVGGIPPRGHVANDRRVPFDPTFFDHTTLQRFGK